MTGRSADSIEGSLDALLEETKGSDEVGVDDLLDTFSDRLFGPFILIIALVVITPLGAVPLLPTVAGALLILVGAQRAVGITSPWLPRSLRDRRVARERMAASFERIRPWARRLDRVARPRLGGLTGGGMGRLNAIVVVASGLMLPPLELVPFGTSLPGASALTMGLAITGRDGAFVIASWCLALSAVGLLLGIF